MSERSRAESWQQDPQQSGRCHSGWKGETGIEERQQLAALLLDKHLRQRLASPDHHGESGAVRGAQPLRDAVAPRLRPKKYPGKTHLPA